MKLKIVFPIVFENDAHPYRCIDAYPYGCIDAHPYVYRCLSL